MGVIPYEYLYFAGKSSEDFDCHISGSGTFDNPQRDISNVSVPGRNGDLHVDNGRFNNIEVVYPAFIVNNFRKNYDALKAFLTSQRGYKRLQDSYHPDYYRLAMFTGRLDPKLTTLNRAASFEICFDCDPRRFLVAGENTVEITSPGEIYNRTRFEALPLIRAYGTGSMTVNGTTIQITTADGYTDIDCELQEAYKGSTNCNGNIVLTDGKFPVLSPGLNEITFTGITKFEITPRWWTI